MYTNVYIGKELLDDLFPRAHVLASDRPLSYAALSKNSIGWILMHDLRLIKEHRLEGRKRKEFKEELLVWLFLEYVLTPAGLRLIIIGQRTMIDWFVCLNILTHSDSACSRQ